MIRYLKADGYYIIHNHASGKVEFSDEDMRVIKFFIREVPRFLGAIVIGLNQGCILDRTFSKTVFTIDDSKISQTDIDIKSGQALDKNKIFTYLKTFSDKKNVITLIYVDDAGHVKNTEEFLNSAFNDKNNFKYIKNQKRQFGAPYVFVYTQDKKIFDDCIESTYFRIISNAFYEDENNDIQCASNVRTFLTDVEYDNLDVELGKEKRFNG